jgi:hypothetical protein
VSILSRLKHFWNPKLHHIDPEYCEDYPRIIAAEKYGYLERMTRHDWYVKVPFTIQLGNRLERVRKGDFIHLPQTAVITDHEGNIIPSPLPPVKPLK